MGTITFIYRKLFASETVGCILPVGREMKAVIPVDLCMGGNSNPQSVSKDPHSPIAGHLEPLVWREEKVNARQFSDKCHSSV